jgi:hypothetical protein
MFGIITAIRAEPIKSINNGMNQETTIQMEENGMGLKKKAKPAKESDESLLKVTEEKKKNLLTDSLDKLIYVDKFSQKDGSINFLTFTEVNKTNSSNSDFGQFFLRPHQNGTNYFEEEKTLATLKLLQSKREEIFKEIFLGFRFSFYPMSRHIFLELSVTPSSEKGPNMMIPF